MDVSEQFSSWLREQTSSLVISEQWTLVIVQYFLKTCFVYVFYSYLVFVQNLLWAALQISVKVVFKCKAQVSLRNTSVTMLRHCIKWLTVQLGHQWISRTPQNCLQLLWVSELGMWRSLHSHSTTFKLRTFSAHSAHLLNVLNAFLWNANSRKKMLVLRVISYP